MSVRWAPAFALALAAVAVFAAVARALPGDVVTVRSADLWATVNVCDTADSPDTIGIRASMPGSPDGSERMYMRFQVQYYSAAEDRWLRVADQGDRFTYLGRGRKPRQAGRSLRITSDDDAPLTLRGKVFFEWRSGGKVVRKARAYTTKGHRSTAGADPAGYTAATCVITPGPAR